MTNGTDDMDSGDDNNNVQVSKAVVLQKSIEFIQYLGSQKKKQEAQLSSLRKEVMITLTLATNMLTADKY